MTRRILDAAHCSVATTDSRQEGRFVDDTEQGRRPQTPGVYPARRSSAGELLASWMPNNGLPVCAMA